MNRSTERIEKRTAVEFKKSVDRYLMRVDMTTNPFYTQHMMNVAPAMKIQAMHDKSVNEEQFLRTACQCISKVVLLRVWKKEYDRFVCR